VYLGGAARAKYVDYDVLEPYICLPLPAGVGRDSARYLFAGYVDSVGLLEYPVQNHVHTRIPLSRLLGVLPKLKAEKVARLHGMRVVTRSSSQSLSHDAVDHNCANCLFYYAVFLIEPTVKKLSHLHVNNHRQGECNNLDQERGRPDGKHSKCNKKSSETHRLFETPPAPLDDTTRDRIIRDACKKMEPSYFEEGGCAVCGELKPLRELTRLKSIKNLLHILAAPGVTWKERKSESDAVAEFTGPVLDYSCSPVCQQCRAAIRRDRVPRLALANNL